MIATITIRLSPEKGDILGFPKQFQNFRKAMESAAEKGKLQVDAQTPSKITFRWLVDTKKWSQ